MRGNIVVGESPFSVGTKIRTGPGVWWTGVGGGVADWGTGPDGVALFRPENLLVPTRCPCLIFLDRVILAGALWQWPNHLSVIGAVRGVPTILRPEKGLPLLKPALGGRGVHLYVCDMCVMYVWSNRI